MAMVEGIESRCFVLDHLFIGEVSLMLDCSPTASVYAGYCCYFCLSFFFFFLLGGRFGVFFFCFFGVVSEMAP